MNKRHERRFRHFAFLASVLLLLGGGCGLWLRAQQRQYRLNRQLIAALIRADDKQALTLVKAGANPNTRYTPTPVPSLIQRWNQLFHQSTPPVNDSPTAFLIACGAVWNDQMFDPTKERHRSEDAPLVRAMLLNGADIRAHDKTRKTALHLASSLDRSDTVDVLLQNGVNIDAQDDIGWTALCDAVYFGENKYIIRQLLIHRADANRRTDFDQNALSLAQQHRQPDVVSLLRQYRGKRKKPDPPSSVPAIARLLGVQVGYNGQDVLTHSFGDGWREVAGEPDASRWVWWNTHSPSGFIMTHGYNRNREGLILDRLAWGRDPAKDQTLPLVRHLPAHAGWLGAVYPGMKTAQVSHLIAGRLPAPQRNGNTWAWTEKGFVRPNPVNDDVYATWTARLSFQNNVLDCIDVICLEEMPAP